MAGSCNASRCRSRASAAIRAAIAALLAGAIACEPPEPAPTPEPVTLAFDGCVAVRRGPRCLIDEQGAALTLWLEVPEDRPAQLRVDGVATPFERSIVDGGQQLRVAVPGTARALEVTGPGFRASLGLGPTARISDLGRAASSLLRGELAGAVELTTPLLVGALVRLRKRLFNGGEMSAAVTVAAWIVMIAEPAGLVSETSEAAQAAAFVLTQRPPRDPGRAARFLELEAPVLADYPAGHARAAYSAALLAQVAGDLRTALREYAEAERRARRLGLLDDVVAALVMRLALLGEVSRGDEVRARTREMDALAEGMSCDYRAYLLTNLGWAHHLLLQAGLPAQDPVPALREALALREGPCADEDKADTLRINLALAAIEEREPEEAARWLDALRDHALSARAAAWVGPLELGIALLAGRSSASEDPVLEPDPAVLDDPELRWPAILWRAENLAAWGLRAPAIAVLREAERLLDEQVHALGIAEGREQFMAGRRRSAELLVDLLVEDGEVAEALCVARLARGRTLRAIDRAVKVESLGPAARALWDAQVADYERHQTTTELARRDRWRHVGANLIQHDARAAAAREHMRRALDEAYALLGRAGAAPTCAELAAPAPGELILLVQAVPDGVVAFAADSTGVTARRLAALDPGDLAAVSRALLGPLRDRLARASALRVLGSSALGGIPVHALPWDDDVVLAALPVVHGLDLPGPRAAVEPGAAAAVVADPTGNLAHAREEAAVVATTLRAQGWQLRAPAEVGGEVMRALLGEVDLLHYAGHGRNLGLGGWDSVLVLADEGTLGVGDILAMRRVPAVVVLAGCETGASDAQALAGGMNLGRAFLLAGSRTVIAASGALDDEIAALVGAELYREWRPDRPLDGPGALRRALLKVRAARPGHTGWQQLHALSP